MVIALEPAETLERTTSYELERAALGRLFFNGMRDELHEFTDGLGDHASDINWPHIIVDSTGTGVEHCSVGIGIDPANGAKTWQISMRTGAEPNEKGVSYLLHGSQFNEEEDMWRLMTVDAQGIARHEAFITNSDGLLTSFMLRALKAARIDAVTWELVSAKESALRAYETHLEENPAAIGAYGNRSGRAQQLFSKYQDTGHASLGIASVRHMVTVPPRSLTRPIGIIGTNDLPPPVHEVLTTAERLQAQASMKLPTN